MAELDIPMGSSYYGGLPDWREERNIRSNAKAERILGLTASSGPYGNEKKKTGFNFSFSDLRDVFPGFSRKLSRSNLHIRPFDTESIVSNPSPTFDPSASTTSLNTTDSSPTITKRRPEQSKINDTAERLSQAETLRVHKIHMPSVEEQDELKQLTASNYPLGIISESTVPAAAKRKPSIASLTSLGSENITQQYQPLQSPSTGNPLVARIAQSVTANTPADSTEVHVQNWLQSARLDRRPSRSSSLPGKSILEPANISSSGESFQTLSSELPLMKTAPPQWPLPATRINFPFREKRISRSDLLNESVLAWSSDEEDGNGETRKRRSIYNPARNPRMSYTNRPSKFSHQKQESNASSKFGHQRQESNASSVIQLDSRPWIRPTSSLPARTFPKRSLADIAASGAYRPGSGESWETDVLNDPVPAETVPSAESETTDEQSFLGTDGLLTATHPLWRSSTGSGDIDINVSRSPPGLDTLVEEKTAETPKSPEDDGLLDISSFPVPPRSRAGSIVPSIQVHNTDGTQQMVQPAAVKYPSGDGVLLAPSTKSRSGSVDSQYSRSSHKGSPSRPPVSQATVSNESGLSSSRRKRTVSNVPIYVTGLENSATNHEEGPEEDVTSYVFSSMF